jgi:hypothetical protein
MKEGDIATIYHKLVSLGLNQGLVMKAKDHSIAVVKRQDTKGIYYTINDRVNDEPQEPYHDSCAMMLLLLNVDRFRSPEYKTTVVLFI